MKTLAFDFGASSGRAILGIYENGVLKTEEIHRFSNDPVEAGGTFYWDILRLFFEIKQSLTKCVNLGHPDIDTIGIDTWGVDFGLLDEDGYLLENPVHYRDKRTENIEKSLFQACAKETIYQRTGIQFLTINTLYQLFALKQQRPALLSRAKTLLFIPDLFAYFLTGEKVAEYTEASTSQFLKAEKRDYDFELLRQLGFDTEMFPKIVKPGTVIGHLKKELTDEIGIHPAKVVAVASHDTASAIVAAPIKKGEKSCYISSGTWSLLGAETTEPIINEKSFRSEITNEGGVEDTFCFLRNISGLWLIQETRRQWIREGCELSFKDIDKMLETETSADVFIDPNCPLFTPAGNMPGRISEFLKKTGQNPVKTKGQTILCILESLALTYRYYIEALEDILGHSIDVIHIIGGGTKDKNLCAFTANATGKRVTAGPVEATALGNIIMQLIAAGEIENVEEARKLPFDVEEYTPKDTERWDQKYQQFKKIKGFAL